jgi:hypothetical protein
MSRTSFNFEMAASYPSNLSFFLLSLEKLPGIRLLLAYLELDRDTG